MGFVRRRSTVLLSATVLAGAALGFEPTVLSNFDLEAHGAKISIGAARVPLWSGAFAQTASTLVLENVVLATPVATYRAKRIELEGVTASRAEMEAILDAHSPETFRERVGKLTAKRIFIPELASENKRAGAESAGTTYNVVLTDVAAGRIGQIGIESGVGEAGQGSERLAVTHGRITALDIDAAEIARIFTERGEATQPLKTLYRSVELENIQVTDGENVDLRIARVAVRDARGRAMRTPWPEFMDRLAAAGESGAGPAQLKAVLSDFADLFAASDVALMEMTGFQGRDPSDSAGAVARIARVAYTGSVDGRTPEARMEGLEVTAKDGSARIANISFTGFSFQPTIEALGSIDLEKLREGDSALFRSFMPTIGTIRFSGLDFDVPNEDKKGPDPDRIRFALQDLELTADKPVNGIPTDVRFRLHNFAFHLPADTQEEGFKDLAALGYKDLNLSFTASANWNEAGKELLVREISSQGLDMGAVALKGVLGNVTKEVFGTDTALATVALLGATAKSAELSVQNTGLFDRYLASEAKKQKKTPEALRREYGTMAAIGIPALLGNSPQAKEVAQAVARFVAKPGKLRISAKAKDPAGLGIADLALVGEPASLLEKVEIKATAE